MKALLPPLKMAEKTNISEDNYVRFTEEEFWASQRTFRAMSQQTFRKWKPGVWAALSTGLYSLEEEEVPEETLVDHQHFSLEPTAGKKDTFAEIKEMFKEIKDALEVNKEKKRVKEIIKCVICQSTCTSSLFFCVAGCGQLIGCFYCASRLQDCPLCRVRLPDTEIRKPLKVSGLADYLGIPEDSMASAIREARVNANHVEDGDDEIL